MTKVVNHLKISNAEHGNNRPNSDFTGKQKTDNRTHQQV